MIITQNQYSVLQSTTRRLKVKIELMNENEAIISTLKGLAIDGSIDLSNNNNYRRTASLKMVLNDNNLIPSEKNKLWFNKRIRLWLGLVDFNDETVWFNFGIYAISDVDLNYDTSEKIISVELLDKMAFIDGTLGGTLANEVEILPEGIDVNTALRAVFSSLGKLSMDDIIIDGLNATIPFEITQDPNSTIYDLAKQLVELYMGYEMYFDERGYLRIHKIMDKKNDPYVWDFTTNNLNLNINYTNKLDFSNIKNSIYVWGKKKDDGSQIKWVYRNRYSRDTLTQRNNIINMVLGDICYVNGISYMWNGSTWEELDFNVIPQFNIEKIGEKISAFTENTIFNESQAKLKAEYELWKSSNFGETISFNCVPNYILLPNKKIKLNLPELNIVGDYLIDSVSVPLNIDSTMSVNARKLYY